jgi:hypothetical protein
MKETIATYTFTFTGELIVPAGIDPEEYMNTLTLAEIVSVSDVDTTDGLEIIGTEQLEEVL